MVIEPTTTTAPSSDELRRLATELRRLAGQLDAAASRATTAGRALAQAQRGARLVLQWGQGEQDKAA